MKEVLSLKQHRTSLKDLAAELDVSIATVSRALHGSHEVSADMRQRVQQLAKERNYHPNPFAQSLRKDVPHIIGVVVPNLVTHYFAAVLDGIEDYAEQHGFLVFSANSHEDHVREERAVESFLAMHVDGVISCLSQDTTDYSHYEQMERMDVPLVFVGRTCLTERFSQVISNGDEAAYEATMHLLSTGSRRVAFLGGPNHLDMVKRRKHGYLQALREAHMPIDRSVVACGKIAFDEAREKTIRMLQSDNPPDAILAFNDILTYAAFDAIKTLRLRIPQDVAIVGFTEGDKAAFVTPSLSAVMDQAHAQGAAACELLLRRINGDRRVYKEVIPMIFKIRESSDKHRSQE